MRLLVLPDAEAVALEAATRIEAVLEGGGQVALSGGSTPKRAYALLAERGHDLSAGRLWMGDERYVPADDERSNARLVREQWLDKVPEEQRPPLEPVDTALDLQRAANDYEVRLRHVLRDGRPLDLALNGIGPDGHTASLFPGKPALEERERWVVEVPEAGLEPFVPRVSMTFPVFNAARAVLFLVAGAEKADAVARAFGPQPDRALPSAHVRPSPGELVLVCDEAAAAGLPDRGAAG